MTAYTPRFAHLVELFQHSVETFADRPAFGTLRGKEWQFITYTQLGERVAHARSALAQLGVGRGDRVAIVAENRIEWVILAHATFQRRAIYVPMSEAQHDAELKYILSDSGAKVCFVANASVAARVASLREDLLDLQQVVRSTARIRARCTRYCRCVTNARSALARQRRAMWLRSFTLRVRPGSQRASVCPIKTWPATPLR